MDIVHKIENVPTTRDKPDEDVTISKVYTEELPEGTHVEL